MDSLFADSSSAARPSERCTGSTFWGKNSLPRGRNLALPDAHKHTPVGQDGSQPLEGQPGALYFCAIGAFACASRTGTAIVNAPAEHNATIAIRFIIFSAN